MRPFFLFALLFASLLSGGKSAFSQSTPPREYLDVNQVSVPINAGGYLFWDLEGQGEYEVPKGSGKITLFSSGLWISGQDVNGDRHTAAQYFNWDGVDFWSGPVAAPAHYNPFSPKHYRVWKVTRQEIENHILQAGQPGYVPPSAILSWPGNGNMAKGEAHQLAPYIETNGNSTYDPLAGDYPDIRGDMAIYQILNDDYGPHEESQGWPFRLEVHLMAYAFSCPQDKALDHTIFLNYRVINRSNLDYHNTFLAFWTFGNIGSPSDDMIACDVEQGAYYFFNGDEFDENSFSHPGYGDHPPAQGIVFLGGPPQEPDGQDNAVGAAPGESVNGVGYGDGIADNERLGMTSFQSFWGGPNDIGLPESNQEYFYYPQGLWRQGLPIRHGGSGSAYNQPPDTVITKYTYPGDSNPMGYQTGGVALPYWSERTAGHTPGNRQGIGSTGPFSFAPGQEVELDLALVYSQDTMPDTLGPSVMALRNDIAHIREVFFSNQSACGGMINPVAEHVASSPDLTIYPNPAQDEVRVLLQGGVGGRLTVMTALGKTIQEEIVPQSTFELKVIDLPPGVYLVRWQGESGTATRRLVVE